METAKLSQKYQIVVPSAVRRKMKLRAGSRVSVYVVDDGRALLVKHPETSVDALRGLGMDIWRKLGGTARYIKRERTSWSKKSALIR